MKTLTTSQAARLTDAADRIDELTAQRPPRIRDEEALAAVINALDTAARHLEAGETIHIHITDEAGRTLATTPIALEPAAS